MVVPRNLRTFIMEQAHDATTGGHLGRDKTLQKLRFRCYWYGMSTDVKLHVSTCTPCNQSKVVHGKPRALMQLYQAGIPGDQLHLDMLGPFCGSNAGNRYVLMIVDQFTQWLEVGHLPTQGAQSVELVGCTPSSKFGTFIWFIPWQIVHFPFVWLMVIAYFLTWLAGSIRRNPWRLCKLLGWRPTVRTS